MLSKKKQIRDRIKNIGKKKFGSKISIRKNKPSRVSPLNPINGMLVLTCLYPKGKKLEECTLEDLEQCTREDDVAAEKVLQQPKVNSRVVVNGKEGCICEKCKDFYPYAEPNMSNGSMICYSCRNPW